jgi:hypothetical protein
MPLVWCQQVTLLARLARCVVWWLYRGRASLSPWSAVTWSFGTRGPSNIRARRGSPVNVVKLTSQVCKLVIRVLCKERLLYKPSVELDGCVGRCQVIVQQSKHAVDGGLNLSTLVTNDYE